MAVTQEVPKFEGHFAWLWWRVNKGSGIISEWVSVLVNDQGYITYPHPPREDDVRRADEIGGEWWDEPFEAPPKL